MSFRFAYKIDPFVQVIERRLLTKIEDDEAAIGIFDVGGDERLESLLSGGVPEL